MQATNVGSIFRVGNASISTLFGVALLLASGDLLARKHPGVIQCAIGCTLSTPNPDEGTSKLLSDEIDRRNPTRGKVWNVSRPDRILVGDIVTVCNGISCVEYTWRGEQFDSGKEVSNILPPPARGGGGGSGSGSGSGSGGGWIGGGTGGGGGSCCGRVTVDPPTMVQ